MLYDYNQTKNNFFDTLYTTNNQTIQIILNCMENMNIPWWRSHPIHENRATKSIWTEPCNPLLRATKSTKRATSA